jgi:hypothetical protein
MATGNPGKGRGRRTIPENVRLAVWVRCGGRCVVCNKYLLDGQMTGKVVPLGELAHIVGQQDTAGSPRGKSELTAAERDSADNLALVCRSEHTEIDNKQVVSTFTVDKLIELKRRHEDRIRHVTGLGEDRSTTVIRMLAPVRTATVELSREDAASTIITCANRFPRYLEDYHRHGLEIDLRHLAGQEAAGPDYYRDGITRIDAAIAKLDDGIARNDVAHISVFAFARIPLLAYLGSRLDDTVPTDIYQRHRANESWEWSADAPVADLSLELPEDASPTEDAVLVLNLSGSIQDSELPAELSGLPVYRLTLANETPWPDAFRHKDSLAKCETAIRNLYASLEATAKNVRRLHAFTAVPLSAAITLGRARDPQVHPALRLYDRTDTGYHFALEIA